jgi:xylan 1,4-beta-xylosidase
VCRVGSDYYLACSSFEYFPGVPIFHSRDLVHWTQIGNVLDRPSQLRLPPEKGAYGGIYAPTLRHHDGTFHLIVTNVSDGGNLLVTAADAAGPWSEPLALPEVPGIDPDLAWDESGDCWITIAGVSQLRVDLATGKLLSELSRTWSGTPGATAPEAPHLYHIGDYWYLMIAEGGTERGHSVSIARGPRPDGPFEPCPANPILTHRGVGSPVQNTGHGDLVEGPDGSWWMVLLGARPQGACPSWHVLGRETFLAPVAWVDGWPVVGELALAMDAPGWPLKPAAEEPVREDFDPGPLHPRWISLRSRDVETCDTGTRPGWLTLRARGGSLDAPDVTFLGRRQQHHTCTVRTLIDPAEGRGGLAVRLDEDHHYEIEADGREVRVHARIGPLRTVVAVAEVGEGPVALGIRMLPPEHAPEPWVIPLNPVTLGFEQPDGAFHPLATLDGRYVSTEVAGGFTGRVLGLYAAEGTVHFDWLDYTC